MQRHYDLCRQFGADPTSEFYIDGKPRTGGAVHREAYWKGRNGIPQMLWPRNSIAYACYMAGKDDRKPVLIK